MPNANEFKWIKKMEKILLNRKIVRIRILTDEEMEALGWYAKAVVLILDDGNAIYASQDDEGNGPGAIFTTYEACPTLPVF